MTPDPLPFLSFDAQHAPLRGEVLEAMARVYDKSWYVMGGALEAFEQAWATFCGAPHCVGVGNGYDALVIALKICGVGPGDEILVPAHTYVATWHAAAQTGAHLRPIEPDVATMNLDTTQLRQHITPRTKAILPVHLYGQACNMTDVMALAREHNLVVIEDNAQAHGATWAGRRTASFGHANATSFYPTKNLGALGDGGALTTADASLDGQARQFRNYGFSAKNVCAERGINSRLDELQAAVLKVKLQHLVPWNDARRMLARQYTAQLQAVGDIILPEVHREAEHVYHLYVIRTQRRDALKETLQKKGIETMVHYPVPPHLQRAYEDFGFRKGEFPLTEQIADTALSLPLWPGMTEEMVMRVCDAVRGFY